MTQLTKKKLKEIMLQVIAGADDRYKDDWYTTDQTFTRYCIEKLAEALNIDLNIKETNE